MTETLYLHIGSPKAASSTIQRYLRDNAAALRRLGYAVAGHDLRPGDDPGRSIWFFQNLLKGGSENAPQVLASRLAKFPTRNAIVSAENLSSLGMAPLFTDVASRCQIHLLYVIRRQDEWIYSAWKQWYSKAGHSLDRYIEMALRDHMPNYLATLESWAEVVGRNHIRVVSLDFVDDTELHHEILRWLNLLDHRDRLTPLGTAANTSFDYRLLDLLARHRGAYEDGHDRKIETFLTRYSRLARKERYRLTDVDSSHILRHFHADNLALLGAEQTATLEARPPRARRVAKDVEPESEHDFAIACLLEALGRMAEDLDRAHQRITELERGRPRRPTHDGT